MPGPDGQTKIRAAAAAASLPYYMISDAGHTQLDLDIVIYMSIGSAPENVIDRITGTYKLPEYRHVSPLSRRFHIH